MAQIKPTMVAELRATLLFANIAILILESRMLELETYLPLCANCSSVRDKSGEWLSLEEYMESNQGKKVTHGVCPADLKPFLLLLHKFPI